MDIFRLVGSILVNNDDANRAIDDTTQRGQNMAQTIGNTVSKAGKTIGSVGKSLAPVSLAVGGVLTASTKGANDFTNGMAKMSTLFDTTQTSVSDLSKQFLNLSSDTGKSASELAEAGYQALSAGQSVDQVGSFVKTSANLAKAGFTTTSTAVDVLTTAMNAYGEKAGTADEISNKLVRTQNLGKTTVDELASSMGKIIPTASAMGVNIDNLTSGYVSLTKQGIATAEATTYMNSMLNELGDSGTTLGGVLKEKTGKSFQELMDEGYSLGDVLKITKEYADENGIAYNELWGSAEAGKAGLAILNGGVDEFNQTVDTMRSKTDDVGDALEKLNTPTAKMNKAMNKLKNSGIQLGTAFMDSLAPTIEVVCDGISRFTQWFDNLPAPMKQAIATTMAVIAVLSPLLIGIGKVADGVSKVIKYGSKLFDGIKKGVGLLKNLWGVLSANPIILVIGAIVALVAGFVYLWNTSEDFRNFWINLWEKIKKITSDSIEAVKKFFTDMWNSIKQTVSEIVEGVSKFFTDMWNDVKNIFKSIVQTVSDAWETVKNVVDVGIQLIVEILKTAFNLITLPFQFIWQNCKDVIIKVWNEISQWLSDKFNEISEVVKSVWTAISNFFSDIWNAISSTVSSVVDAISSKIKAVWDVISEYFTNIWNQIKTTVSNAINAVKNVITNVMNAISSFLSGVWNSIKTTVSSVWDSISSKISSVMNTIKNTVSNIWNSITSTVSGIVDSMKNAISNAFDAIHSKISGILNGVKNTFTNTFNGIKSFMSGIVDWLKGIFNFSWNLPHIKLPHFSVSGKFSLDPPSIPHFGIDWYKKAMDQPYLFTKPTLFGTNSNGQAMGAGDAGDEIMLGRNAMLDMIRSAVSAETSQMVQVLHDALNEIISKMDQTGNTGDIVIPVYLGNNMMDEIIVDAKKRVTMRSGGLTNV